MIINASDVKSKYAIETGNVQLFSSSKIIDFHYESCERSYVSQYKEYNIQIVLMSTHGNENMFKEKYSEPYVKITNVMKIDEKLPLLQQQNNEHIEKWKVYLPNLSVILDCTNKIILWMETEGNDEETKRLYMLYSATTKKPVEILRLGPLEPLVSIAKIIPNISNGIIYVENYAIINTLTPDKKCLYHHDCDILDLTLISTQESQSSTVNYAFLDYKFIQLMINGVKTSININT
jgi:hypothetical protein